MEANSKPHDHVIYTNGSVTRDRSGWGFTVKQGGRTVHEDSGVTTSSLIMQVEAVTHAIQWLAFQSDAQITQKCHFSHRTCCKRFSLESAAPTGIQPDCKDFCGFTALGMPESAGMNG